MTEKLLGPNGEYLMMQDMPTGRVYDLTKLDQIAEALWEVGRAADMLVGKPDKGHYDIADDRQKGLGIDYLVSMIGKPVPQECTEREFMIHSIAFNLLKIAGY